MEAAICEAFRSAARIAPAGSTRLWRGSAETRMLRGRVSISRCLKHLPYRPGSQTLKANYGLSLRILPCVDVDIQNDRLAPAHCHPFFSTRAYRATSRETRALQRDRIVAITDKPDIANVNPVQSKVSTLNDRARTVLALVFLRMRLGHREGALQILDHLNLLEPGDWVLYAAEVTRTRIEGRPVDPAGLPSPTSRQPGFHIRIPSSFPPPN